MLEQITLTGKEDSQKLRMFFTNEYQQKKVNELLDYIDDVKSDNPLWYDTYYWSQLRRQYCPEQYVDMLFTLWKDEEEVYSDEEVDECDIDYVDAIQFEPGCAEESKEAFIEYMEAVRERLPHKGPCGEALMSLIDELIEVYDLTYLSTGCFKNVGSKECPSYEEVG